jgi:PTS system ascorbate-specific IIA component
MNKLLIIAHAPLASALRLCALHVFPDLANDLQALDVNANAPPEQTREEAQTMIETLDSLGQDAVMILTDVFGATPCNIAQRLVNSSQRKLVAGVNLPMLLRAATYRFESLESMVTKALAGGMQGVMPVAVSAPQNQARLSDAHKHHYDQQ